ncbi:MAG: type II toxin-antitoxin system RelE/ParE family toxin [Chitinophagales bacterium]
MSNNFILSKKAVEDLSEIWEYTIQIWSETQADKYYFMLLGVCQDMANGKVTARQYPEIHSEILGTRAGQHIIFFRHVRKNTIEVVRILHSRMDLRNRIEE